MLRKICFFSSLLCLSLTAQADVFSVSKVPVDVTSDSSTHAREEALSQAQQQAFEILIQRIARAEDVQQLEWPVAEDIVNWVSDVSMSNEKTSPVRYIADVNVRFDAEKIKTWLEEKEVPYMAQTMEAGWVLPVFNGPVADTQDGDPWVKAWQTAYNSDIVPLYVPSAAASEDEIEAEQKGGKTFWAIATWYPDRIQVQFKPLSSQNTLLPATSLIQPLSSGQDVPWEKLVQKVQKQLEKMWLDRNIVHFDKPSFISVIVPIKDLSEWVKTREQLDKIKLIKKYDVRAMRKDQAQIDVYFAGKLDVFIKAMDQENLFLSAMPDNSFWVLRSSRDVPQEEKDARVLPPQQILFPVVVGDDDADMPAAPEKIRLRESTQTEEAPAAEPKAEETAELKSAQPQEETRALMSEDESQ